MTPPKKQVSLAMSMLAEAECAVSLKEMQAAGVAPTTIQRLVSTGRAVRAAFGHVALPDRIDILDEAWVSFSLEVPTGVICLYSAANEYGMTQEMPPELHVLVPWEHRRRFAPDRQRDRGLGKCVHALREPIFLEEGVDTIYRSGAPIRITSRERTLVDMYLFSSFNAGAGEFDLVVPDESFLDSLNRAASDPEFSFDKAHDIANTLGCSEAMSAFTKTFRYGQQHGFVA